MPSLITYINRIAEVAIDYCDKAFKKDSKLKEKLAELDTTKPAQRQIEALLGLQEILLNHADKIKSTSSSRLLHLQYFITSYIHFRLELATVTDWSEQKWSQFKEELLDFYSRCDRLGNRQSLEVNLKLPKQDERKVTLTALTATSGLMKTELSDYGLILRGYMLDGDWQTGIKLSVEQYKQHFEITSLKSELESAQRQLDEVQRNLLDMVAADKDFEDLAGRVNTMGDAYALLQQRLDEVIKSEADVTAEETSDDTSALQEEIAALQSRLKVLEESHQLLLVQIQEVKIPKPDEEQVAFTKEHLALLTTLTQEVKALRAENAELTEAVKSQATVIEKLDEALVLTKSELETTRLDLKRQTELTELLKNTQSMRFFPRAKPDSQNGQPTHESVNAVHS